MSATAPARRITRRQTSAPDLNYFRQHYPETVANFGALPQREEWLRRVWDTETQWQSSTETGRTSNREVIVRGAPPSGVEVEAEFDVIYAGGGLGLLHAATLACRYGRRVLVFDEDTVGHIGRGWNVSDEDLKEFERAGLLTTEEIESSVINRYGAGFVKFHDAQSKVKADALWVNGVMEVMIDPDTLLQLAADKIRTRGPAGCMLVDGLSLSRAYIEKHRITIEAEDTQGVRRRFRARMFVDAGRGDSSVARQIRGGRALTHFCPTVGTVARGFVSGEGPNRVDFRTGEILVSTEDASEHRQLMWEGFPGDPRRGDYATFMFFHDAAGSPADKSLLSLFERYFETLPSYKRKGTHWRVEKPLFGYAPAARRRSWNRRERISDDRVMLVGEAAGVSASWGVSGVGGHLRNLRGLTNLVDLALEADMLDAASLGEVADRGSGGSGASALADFLRPTPRGGPAAVNETLNAVMAALHGLDERVRRQLLQDRLTPGALKSLLSRTVKLYPRIIARVREHLGARGTFWWLANFAEALWNERRDRHTKEISNDEELAESPERKFARQLALYKNGQSMEDHG